MWEININNSTISSLLKLRTQESPNKVIIIENERKVTWKELTALSNYAASQFIDAGIRKNSHVGLFCANSLEWIVSYLALTRIGALPVLINYNYKSIELKDITCYADLEFLLYGDGYKKIKYIDLIDSINFKQIPNFKACFDIGEKRFRCWMNNYKDFDPSYYSIIDSNIDTHDNLNMIFTSGTTSKVKGVVLTHYQMLNISNLQIESLRWTEEDVVCLPLPFFHCFGLSCGLLASLNKNLQLCLTSTRSLPILQTIEKYRCTVLNGVPSMYKSLMNNKDFDSFDLTSLKSGIIAGECVSPKNFKE
ncbi:MAG: AMP-binding protein, partial [Sphaerochaetaceae bacterium]